MKQYILISGSETRAEVARRFCRYAIELGALAALALGLLKVLR